jgi:hypothetical protein
MITTKPIDGLQVRTGLTTDEVVANILVAWTLATDANREDGAQWYLLNQQALEEMANGTGVSLETAAAVTAHLSPRIHWARNLVAAHNMLHGLPVTGVLGRSISGAQSALDAYRNGEEPLWTLKGQKIKNFALNLIGDTEAVTIDVWAARVAFGGPYEDKILQRAGVYNAIAEAYRIAAVKVGVSPSTMQATCWIVARNGKAN